MKITIVAHYFETADEPGLTLLGSLSEHLAAAGHDVGVVAGRHVRMGRRPAPRFTRTPSGYTIRRTWSGNEASFGIVSRILSFVGFSVTSLFGLARSGRADIVFASSPPIFPMLTAWFWARLTRARFVLEVCDLWPDSVIALGVVRNPLLIWLTRRLEIFLYRRADAIVALTAGVAGSIRSRKVTGAPIHVVRGATDSVSLRADEDMRAATRQRMGWEGRTVAIFAGTTGYAQDIGTLVAAAERLGELKTLLVVVLGSGAERGIVEQAAACLPNLALLDPVPKREMAGLLAAADIGICTLRDHPLFDGAIPTKLIDYMAAGLPVVAADMREIAEVAVGQDVRLYRAGDPASLEREMRILAEELAASPRGQRRPAKTALPDDFTLDARNAKIEAILAGLAAPR